MFEGEHIWIVGASSGIGEALARALSARGATLVLSARAAAPLEALNVELGGRHHVVPMDVASQEQVAAAFKLVDDLVPSLNRAVFMAAVYNPDTIEEMDLDFAETMLGINVLGAFIFTKSIVVKYKDQGFGQIALCGSVAAYTGLPQGQPYSSTKAALKNFSESLVSELPPTIDVKLISPGFVRTRITDMNDFEMPYIIEPEDAANEIIDGLQSKRFEIHFPKKLSLRLKLLSMMPSRLKFYLTRQMSRL